LIFCISKTAAAGIDPMPRRFFVVKMPTPGEDPASAFAKGGDSEEHLEVSLFRLHRYDTVQPGFHPSPNVTVN
jgi:hypothetical protein